MAKKPRLKGSAFDWVEKTAGKKETSENGQPTQEEAQQRATGKSAEKKKGARTKTPKAAASEKKTREIFVKYRKDDGQIVAMREILHQPEKTAGPPWPDIPDDMEAGRLDLTDDLAEKKLIDLHTNYRVTKSGVSIRLILKSQ
jgi:hypothetical protein